MAKKKIELYAEAPYKQGYDSAKANETFYNPYSDIEGAQKFGFKTIWFNSKQKELPKQIQPTMTVTKLEDIIPSFLLHPNI